MLKQLIKRIKSCFLSRKFRNLSVEERFTEIYRIGWWAENKESTSGSGSTLENTSKMRESLPGLVAELGIKTLFDVPCGDFNWMQHVKFNPPIDYIGGDIVASVIADNQKKYAGDRHSFRQFNLISDKFPEVDMLFCRDCLFHLSYDDIWAVLDNFSRSSIPYLLVTNMPEVDKNRNIITGQHRLLNLCQAPFNFPKPISELTDYVGKRVPKVMALWRLETVKEVVAGRCVGVMSTSPA
jgi:hypothetical protein